MDKITLVIPTHNRHAYLRRALDYYSGKGLNIMVLDSSKEPADIPEGVQHLHLPHLDAVDKFCEGVHNVKTEYLVLCPDDDFLIPEALLKCIMFLDRNKDYSSAQGHYTSFYNRNGKIVFGPSMMHIVGMDNNSDDPIARLNKQLSFYMDTVYCVHRTNLLQETYSYGYKTITDYNLMELIVTITTLINGKHKVLPVFYCLKESIEGAGGDHAINLDVAYELDRMKSQVSIFRRILAQHLVKRSGMTRNLAQRKMDEVLDAYVSNLRLQDRRLRMRAIKLFDSISGKFGKAVRYPYFEIRRRININRTKSMKGFPFHDNKDRRELERMEQLIRQHNIPSKWRSIIL